MKKWKDCQQAWRPEIVDTALLTTVVDQQVCHQSFLWNDSSCDRLPRIVVALLALLTHYYHWNFEDYLRTTDSGVWVMVYLAIYRVQETLEENRSFWCDRPSTNHGHPDPLQRSVNGSALVFDTALHFSISQCFLTSCSRIMPCHLPCEASSILGSAVLFPTTH